MAYKYSVTIGENEAKAVGIGLGISSKHGKEVCKAVRGKSLEKAKQILSDVINFKKAVPYRKHDWDLAHKKGIGPGRYPIKTCQAILDILNSAETNAQFKGLSTANLHVRHISAQRGPATARSGRRRGLAKRSHLEIVLTEKKETSAKKKAPVKKVTPKTETPKEAVKAEPKKETPVKKQEAPKEKQKAEPKAAPKEEKIEGKQ